VNGSIDFGGGPLQGSNGAVMAVLDDKGNHLWSRALQTAQTTLPLAVDGAGDIHLAGGFLGSFDLGGGPTAREAAGIFVGTLDPAGKVVQSTEFGVGSCQGPSDCLFGVSGVGASADGHTALGGVFAGSLDAAGWSVPGVESQEMNFMAALDPAGKTQWAHAAGMLASVSDAMSVAVDGAGEVVAGGNFWCSVDLGGGTLLSLAGASDTPFVAKLGPDGSQRYSRTFGGSGGVAGVATTPAGEAIVIGQYQGTLDVGGMVLSQQGSSDTGESFVVRLAP